MKNIGTTEIYQICKLAMECIVSDNYEPLRKENALTRVSESDIKRVLAEYSPGETPVMPPDGYFEKAPYINTYTDGSGYLIGINLWYASGESDLTLQLDIRKKDNGLAFIVSAKKIGTHPMIIGKFLICCATCHSRWKMKLRICSKIALG